MGLVAAAAFVLATQSSPSLTIIRDPAFPPTQVSKARLDEIWGHIDNRLINQSDIWYEDGEFPNCVSLLRVQHAYSPDDQDVMTSLGWMLENIELMDEARLVYKEFSDRNPEKGDAVFPLAFSYYNAKEWDNAIRVLEPSLSKNASPNTYRILAKCYERKKMYKDAIRIWELELKKFPDEPTAVANIKRVKAKIASGG